MNTHALLENHQFCLLAFKPYTMNKDFLLQFLLYARLFFLPFVILYIIYKKLNSRGLIPQWFNVWLEPYVSMMQRFFSPFLVPFRSVVLRVQNWYETSHLKKEIDLTNQPKWRIESEPPFLKAFVEKHPKLKYYVWFSYIGMFFSYLFKDYFIKSNGGQIILLTLITLLFPGVLMIMLYFTIRILYRFSQWRKIFVWNPGIHTVAAVWNGSKLLVKSAIDSYPVASGTAGLVAGAATADELSFVRTGNRPFGVWDKLLTGYGYINPEKAQDLKDAMEGETERKLKELEADREAGRKIRLERLEAERKLAELKEDKFKSWLDERTLEDKLAPSYKLEEDVRKFHQMKDQEAQAKVSAFLQEQRGETAPSNRFTGEANK
jgi:hypothetical protein